MTVAAHVCVILAGALTFLSALGMWAMRTPLQRLHFLSPPATAGAGLVSLALWLGERDVQAGIKGALTALALLGANSIVAHATARAIEAHEPQEKKP